MTCHNIARVISQIRMEGNAGQREGNARTKEEKEQNEDRSSNLVAMTILDDVLAQLLVAG